MPMHNQTAGNSYTRFMQAVNEELTKFECSERDLKTVHQETVGQT